ncbi:MAG TPA: helix-turn-helix domain-containing protein [Actinoplanes sp.]|nr:helix-turn-helix domain-containing protein [Actinoplanes sp.]
MGVALNTKDTIVVKAMELFGRQGYHATTIAQIEAAAGLSAGAGGLYRHFKSKRAVLEEALRRQAEEGRPLLAYLSDPSALASRPRRERFLAVARAGLRRLAEERDINRLLLRDLATFPDLLELVRAQELTRVHEALTEWLRREVPEDADHAATAAVLIAAVSHYWTLADVFDGKHPHVDQERFLNALADLATGTSR